MLRRVSRVVNKGLDHAAIGDPAAAALDYHSLMHRIDKNQVVLIGRFRPFIPYLVRCFNVAMNANLMNR
jgi:hypothetical protein